MIYKTQVTKKHYHRAKYQTIERWISYYHQLNSVELVATKLHKSNLDLLEIGVGDRSVSTLLAQSGHHITTMDMDKRLEPDYLSALPKVPKFKRHFDCIVCCEVLEHITYEDVEKSLVNLAKITKFIILSIPHKSFYFSLVLRLPTLSAFSKLFTFPTSFVTHEFNGEHYWELGTKGYSLKRLLDSFRKARLKAISDFRITEFPYHHFFILETK